MYIFCLPVFQYKPVPHKPGVIFSVLQELARMDKLETAISGRNEEEILPLLKYLRRYDLVYLSIYSFISLTMDDL